MKHYLLSLFSKIVHSLGHFMILLFILYINALPILKNVNYKIESNYLQSEILGEEDLEEREFFIEKQEKKELVCSAKFIDPTSFIGHHFSEFNPDIQIPPPKYS